MTYEELITELVRLRKAKGTRKALLLRIGGCLMDMSGIQIIGDMSKEELVDEIQKYNRKMLMNSELPELKGLLIDARMNQYRDRLEREAKIQVHRSIFGSHVHETDED